MLKVFIGILVATIIVLVAFQFIDPHLNVENNFGSSTSLVQEGNTIHASIEGEITRPGRYSIDKGRTLGDLIYLAQDVTGNADELAYDVSYVLKEGLTFYIARKFDTNDVCTSEPIAKVDINHDGEERLARINGIGAALARKIVDYRKANGDFGRIEDIRLVNGVGNATFAKIKDLITLRSS